MVEGDVPALGSSDRTTLVHPGRLVNRIHLADGCVDHRQHEKHLACGLQLTVNQKSGNRHHQAGEQAHTSMEKQPNGKQNRRHSRNAQDDLLQHIVGDALAFQLEVFLFCLPNGFVHSLFSRPAATECPYYLIIFIGIWGNSIPTMMVSLTASLILRMIKLVKTRTEMEMAKAYIMCAVSSGASRFRILLGHVLPNIGKEIVRFLCLSCAEMIMAISGFSFIGLTLGDDVIDWGSMLSSARSYLGMAPMLLFYPILFIFLSTLSFNILGKKLEKEDRADA